MSAALSTIDEATNAHRRLQGRVAVLSRLFEALGHMSGADGLDLDPPGSRFWQGLEDLTGGIAEDGAAVMSAVTALDDAGGAR